MKRSVLFRRAPGGAFPARVAVSAGGRVDPEAPLFVDTAHDTALLT